MDAGAPRRGRGDANAQGGSRLASEVMRSIANEYGWPDFHSAVHTAVKLPTEALKQYVGAYQMRPGLYMTITMSGEQLMSRLGGQDALPIFAEAPDRFFPKVVDSKIGFVKDASGEVTTLVLHQNGHDTPMNRLSDAEGKRIIDESAARAALAAQRFKDQKPAPGTEDAIRQDIADIIAGQPKYDRSSIVS
jgi:hypothetical protein